MKDKKEDMKKRAVCPWWLGYFLISPFRKLRQDPYKILGPYLRKGMRCLDLGPGMGYFSIPMGELVGASGKVYCVDIQKKMLEKLKERVQKKKLEKIIETRLCSEDSLEISDLSSSLNFILAFAVMHELKDKQQTLNQLYSSLKPAGQLLISEPLKHVTEFEMQQTIANAEEVGFKLIDRPRINLSISALLKK
ncbi:MAG: methyltransferase domain-containing protein [bacterium]|nr:methyltransferase domain-containing protein [bacterium]